jgi:DNA adenine methylase
VRLDAHLGSLGLEPGGFEYYEPMCGSLSVGLHVMAKYKPREAVVGDASPDIINFFQHVRNAFPALEARIRELQGATGLCATRYYDVRHRFNERRDSPLDAAAQFYVLNRACFNGVYRVNGRGEFNVPFGRFRGSGHSVITEAMWGSLRRAHEVLASVRVRFVCLDVEAFVNRHSPKSSIPSLVYCDPPYIGTDRCLYQPRDHFGIEKHRRLERVWSAWASRGAHIMITQSNAALVRDVFREWVVEEMRGERRVGCKVETRGEGVFDVLIHSTSSQPGTGSASA